MNGNEVKRMIIEAGVKLWQVASALGMNDGNFSRRLRKPFNAAEIDRIKAIIAELTANKTKTA